MHMPRKGILFLRAYLEDMILPSPPREPNPGKINIPSTPLYCFFAVRSSIMFSVFTHLIFTLALFSTPA